MKLTPKATPPSGTIITSVPYSKSKAKPCTIKEGQKIWFKDRRTKRAGWIDSLETDEHGQTFAIVLVAYEVPAGNIAASMDGWEKSKKSGPKAKRK